MGGGGAVLGEGIGWARGIAGNTRGSELIYDMPRSVWVLARGQRTRCVDGCGMTRSGMRCVVDVCVRWLRERPERVVVTSEGF